MQDFEACVKDVSTKGTLSKFVTDSQHTVLCLVLTSETKDKSAESTKEFDEVNSKLSIFSEATYSSSGRSFVIVKRMEAPLEEEQPVASQVQVMSLGVAKDAKKDVEDKVVSEEDPGALTLEMLRM